MQTRKHLCKQNISVDQNGEKRTNINWKAFKVRKEELNKESVQIIIRAFSPVWALLYEVLYDPYDMGRNI